MENRTDTLAHSLGVARNHNPFKHSPTRKHDIFPPWSSLAAGNPIIARLAPRHKSSKDAGTSQSRNGPDQRFEIETPLVNRELCYMVIAVRKHKAIYMWTLNASIYTLHTHPVKVCLFVFIYFVNHDLFFHMVSS